MDSTSRIPSASLLPGTLPPEQLFWHWRRSISPYFDSVPLYDPEQPPQLPEIHMFNAGGFLFMDTKFSAQKFVRNSSWLHSNDDADHVGIQLFLSGRNQCENGGRDFVLDPTGIFAVNLGYEVDALCSDAEVLSIVLPRERISEDLPALADARGQLFDAGSTSGKLLGGFLHLLRTTMPGATAEDAPVLSEALIGLLRTLLGGDTNSAEAHAGVRAAVQKHIDRNLGMRNLGTESICAHFQMSRATLYRILKPSGGVREYIQRRRLMAVFRALASPANMERGIFEIALDYGFGNPSHLSTRFRDHFGMTPSEVHEAARSHIRNGRAPLWDRAREHGLSDAEIMERWSKELGSSGQPSNPGPVETASPDA